MGATRSAKSILFSAILVVVLFIVLSTATYAWYSANNVVQADNVVFTSSASDTEGGLLGIGKTPDATETRITFDQPDAFHPMIPISQATIGETTYEEFVAGFNKTSEGGDPLNPIAKLDGTAIDPLTLSVGGQAYFYVVNRDVDAMRVKVAYFFDEEEGAGLKDKLHVAFFTGANVVGTTLSGIASLSEIHYGSIHVGDAVNDTPVMPEGIRKDSGEMEFVIQGEQAAVVRLVVWLDGVGMKNAHGSKNMLFGLTFNGAGM